MYRFKLKEIEVGDTEIRGGKKSTVSAIDDATGRIEWDIVDAADFSSVYKALSKANDFLSTLEKEGKAKDDVVIDGFAEDIAKLFNAFRTHVRKVYPKEYERVSRLKEDLEINVELRPTKEKLKVTIPGDFDDNEGEYAVTKELKSQNKEYKDFRIKDIKLKEAVVSDNESSSLKAKIAADDFMRIYRSEFRRVFSNFGKEAEAEFKKIVKLKICQLQEEEVEEGEGIGYLTPNAFSKKGMKSKYKYSLGSPFNEPVPKKVKGSGIIVKQLFEKTDRNEFQTKRIAAFDEVEERFNNISKLISNAKNETAKYYNENPGSYAVVYSTDYIFELLEEIEAKLTNNPE